MPHSIFMSGELQDYNCNITDYTTFKVGKNQPVQRVHSFFGIELELKPQGKGLDWEGRRSLLARLNSVDPEFAIIKYDSSVAEGFEINTAPATMELVLQNLTPFFESAPQYYIADQTAGLHIHMSRPGKVTIMKMHAFVNAPANHRYIDAIAGRRISGGNTSYATFSREPSASVARGYGNDGKYTALNTLHHETLEFRIFAATTNWAVFKRRLQFVDALRSWCEETPISKIGGLVGDWPRFNLFVLQDKGKRWENLKRWIESGGWKWTTQDKLYVNSHYYVDPADDDEDVVEAFNSHHASYDWYHTEQISLTSPAGHEFATVDSTDSCSECDEGMNDHGFEPFHSGAYMYELYNLVVGSVTWRWEDGVLASAYTGNSYAREPEIRRYLSSTIWGASTYPLYNPWLQTSSRTGTCFETDGEFAIVDMIQRVFGGVDRVVDLEMSRANLILRWFEYYDYSYPSTSWFMAPVTEYEAADGRLLFAGSFIIFDRTTLEPVYVVKTGRVLTDQFYNITNIKTGKILHQEGSPIDLFLNEYIRNTTLDQIEDLFAESPDAVSDVEYPLSLAQETLVANVRSVLAHTIATPITA